MTRQRLVWLLVAGLLIALVAWIASRTYWDEATVPLPPKGEALTNPHYVAQRFAAALGATTVRDRALAPLPSPDAVIVLADWHWGLSAGRREALKRWVEAGGRLVVDRSLVGAEEDLAEWAGIARRDIDLSIRTSGESEDEDPEATGDAEADSDTDAQETEQPPAVLGFPRQCREAVMRDGEGNLVLHRLGSRVSLCGFSSLGTMTSVRPVEWSLNDSNGMQVVRVAVGRGSVTAINAVPFRYRGLFDGGHGALFVLATQLERGDAIHFRSETDHPSVFVLMWRHGAPVVVLMLVFVAFGLWRGAVRLGPVTAEPERVRRSLAEQIRGTGQFALRFGRGEALRLASVRALEDIAQGRFPGFARLSAPDRAAKLAELTQRDPEALRQAMLFSGQRRPNELRSAIALLEAARRDLKYESKRT